MDFIAIFALIEKGLTVIQALYEAGQTASPAISALIALVTGAQKGAVTDDDLTKTEALLDQLIDDFNIDIP